MPRVKVIGPNVGMPAVVGVILVALRLSGVIDWSWWLVLLPLYLPWAVFIATVVWVMFFVLTLDDGDDGAAGGRGRARGAQPGPSPATSEDVRRTRELSDAAWGQGDSRSADR